MFTLTHFSSLSCSFFLQIHANCRIRSVYFSDRFYSHEELPSDYRVNVLGERPTAPSITIVKADVLPQAPAGSGLQSQRISSKPRPETGCRTPVSGEENVHGFQTVLHSIGWSPLQCWKKVSVCETMNSPSYCQLHFHYNQFVSQLRKCIEFINLLELIRALLTDYRPNSNVTKLILVFTG